MENEKAVAFIENSFLKSLLIDEGITDISFNGDFIFFEHNEFGRMKSDIIINQPEAKDFIRQIANLTEKQFSYQIPLIDVSVGKFRINAVHQSIGRLGDQPSITFSIRVASDTPRITDESSFLTKELKALFKVLLDSKMSIVIGGVTGSGKTEFQKYLICKMRSNERVIIIDNVLELDRVRLENDTDINSWQIDDRNPYSSIQLLVRNALRSNPDWIIVAESRGSEMVEILNSTMTGHPIITTIHAYDVLSMPNRIIRMVMMGDKKTEYKDIEKDVNYHFKYYVYLEKETDNNGKVNRYIKAIAECLCDGRMNIIYENKNGVHFYKKIINTSILKYFKDNKIFIDTFIGG